MSEHTEQVREFHKTFGIPIGKEPRPSMPRSKLRTRLIREEFRELCTAIATDDFIEAVDALADLLYVVHGAAIEWGVDMDPIMREVHRSNMTKLGKDGKTVIRDGGKVLKGPNFSPPQIKNVLAGMVETEHTTPN